MNPSSRSRSRWCRIQFRFIGRAFRRLRNVKTCCSGSEEIPSTSGNEADGDSKSQRRKSCNRVSASFKFEQSYIAHWGTLSELACQTVEVVVGGNETPRATRGAIARDRVADFRASFRPLLCSFTFRVHLQKPLGAIYHKSCDSSTPLLSLTTTWARPPMCPRPSPTQR